VTAAPSGPLRSPVDGILFDVDDTLVDTKRAFAQALAGVRAAFLQHLTTDDDAALLEAWRADVGGHYRAYTRGEVTARVQRMTRANALHREFGGPALDDGRFDEWDAVFVAGFEAAWTPHTDARQVIDSLRAAGIAVGALSNAPVAHQTRKMQATGLADVPLLVGVDTLGVGKPDPRVFLEACRLLGTDPGATVYVGDELDVDAVAAVRAGLAGVWLDRPGPRRVPVSAEDVEAAVASGVRVIGSLDELAQALELPA